MSGHGQPVRPERQPIESARAASIRPGWLFVCMLPIAALATFYLLAASKFVADTPADLEYARYGLPFAWIEQDLSRYDPVRFPVTIDFNWTRAWHDPIVTHYDWIMLAVNVLLVGVVLTACLIGMISLMGRRAKRTGSQ